MPICSYCKRIRGDQNYWERVESYLTEHTDAKFSHGICPECYDKALAELDSPSTESSIAADPPPANSLKSAR